MSTNLNIISPNFRDNLLKRNLAFAKTVEDNNYSQYAYGIGKPVNLNDSPDYIQPSIDFDEVSEQYRNSNTRNNDYGLDSEYSKEFIDNSETALFISNGSTLKDNLNYNLFGQDGDNEVIDINTDFVPQNTNQNPYVDSNGNITGTYNGDIKTINDFGSVLTGQGFRLDDGIEANYDVRSTLLGRAIANTGNLTDTPLGEIQSQELAKTLKNRILYNTQRETLGKVNLNIFNAIEGGDIIRPNYDITVGHNFGTKLLKTVEDLTGFYYPASKISENASIYNDKLSAVEYSNNLIKNTGRGQVRAMFSNLKLNKYKPSYVDNRTKDGLINVGSEDYDVVKDKFIGLSPDNTDDYQTISPSPDSILFKTKEMFSNGGNKNLISKKGMLATEPSEIESTVNFNGTKIISKGSGVKSFEGLSGSVDPDKVFGRVFTKDDGYDKVSKLQKHTGLNNKNYSSESVLDSNGFVKIGPYKSDNPSNPKKFMFSIENLAWADNIDKLPNSEIGSGDPVTGVKGRVMWFPPYDISITDNNSVNWESTNFIGRGEPMYTYNNTERMGTLSFKMVIDYPSYLEELKGVSDDVIHSIMSGVRNIEYTNLRNLSINEVDNIRNEVSGNTEVIVDDKENEPDGFEVYFPDNVDEFDSNYEYNEGQLNSFFNGAFVSELSNKLKNECPSCKVVVRGFMSMDEVGDIPVASNRAYNFISYLKGALDADVENRIVESFKPSVADGCDDITIPADSECKKEARRVEISFEYVPTENKKNIENEKPKVNTNFELNNEILSRFMNESLYFEKLKESDPLVYEDLKSKLDFFHPAFHSTTPEGFNSRLNFLLQCTRQGPTINKDNANNLAFGRAPICILRVGDFYHTKIAIDNVSFSYEPLVWDMNPEGIGVQPMICRVDLSFKIIGGSSLKGPINKLQNAVSFNYFGNTETFDPRADKITKIDGVNTYNSIDDLAAYLENGLVINDPKNDIQINEEARMNKINETSTEVASNTDNIYYNLKISSVDFDGTKLIVSFVKDSEAIMIGTPIKLKFLVDNDFNDDGPVEVGVVTLTDDNYDSPINLAYDNVVPGFEVRVIAENNGRKIWGTITN